MKIGILHLSDLHIENNECLNKIDLIISACNYDIKLLSNLYILVTGDIVDHGREEEYDNAELFLNLLKDKIKGSNKLLQIKFVLVPGNHDCCFDKVKSTREDLITNCLTDKIEKNDYFDDITVVQENYWNFFNKIKGFIPNDKISYKEEFPISINCEHIVFLCYNSSWMSEKEEKCGNIVIPENKFIKNINDDIIITLFHHPTSWLSPNTKNNNKKRFEEHIINTSNIILCGHEHDKGITKNVIQNNNNVIYIEGKAFKKKSPDVTGFNYIEIDMTKREGFCKKYISDGNIYITEDQSSFKLCKKEKRKFIIMDDFCTKIESLNIPLKHARKSPLLLTDVFIYPDLEPVKEDDAIQYPNSKFIIDSIKNNNKLKLFIEGEEQSGKTSLLFAYYKKLYEMGYNPIYLRGNNINHTNVKDLIAKALKEQYENNDIDLFFQQEKRVLLIDNLQKSVLNSKYIEILLNNIIEQFDYIIITIDSSMIANLASIEATNSNFDSYRILPLGHVKRSEMIKQWLTIGENAMTLQKENLLELIKARLDEIDQLIGNKLMPSYPIFILTLLQGLDDQIFPQDYTQTSYAHCYHALITVGLVRIGLQNELGSYFNLLKELSFYVFEKQTDNFSKLEFENFFIKFKNRFYTTHSSDKMLQNICDANLIKYDDEIYSFSYKYIFYYLVAQKMATNIDKHQKIIENLCDNIHIEKNANILIFLTHHSKAQLLLDNIILASQLPFEKSEEITLDKNDPFTKFISEFAEKVKNDIIEIKDPEQEVKKELEFKDNIEKSNGNHKIDNEDLPPELIEINQSLKTIRILGQIVKNQNGDFEKEKLEILVESAYRGCFRFMGFFTDLLQKDKDIIVDAISDKLKEKSHLDKIDIEKKVLTFLQFISYRICIDSFTNLMFSVGTNVNELYETIARKIGTLAAKIVTFAIKSYYAKINTTELEQLFKDVQYNYIAQSILRIYVKKYLYTNYVERSKREKIIKIAGFKSKYIVPKLQNR